MGALRLYSRDELLAKLAIYKCKFVASVMEGVELWETGWHEPFTLYRVLEDRYSDDQYRRVLVFIGKTIPPDWHENGN